MNEKCNLACEKCHVANRANVRDCSIDEVKMALNVMRSQNIISLAITGGEPFIWSDGKENLETVVEYAHKIGFATICIYTNGTLPLESSADVLFVGLDDINNSNCDSGQCPTSTIINNIQKSHHPYIALNSTVTKKNLYNIESHARQSFMELHIKSIFFYLHTPYYGFDDNFLSSEERKTALDLIIKMKKNGYPIINSISVLEGVKNNKWERPSNNCQIYGEGKFFNCCRAEGNNEACVNCGYLGYAELEYISHLNLNALTNAIRHAIRINTT